jgi:hypothetical protein
VIGDHSTAGDLTFSPCSPTTQQIAVAATDNVGVARAVLSWSGAGVGSGSVPMTLTRNLWIGTLGPYQVVDESVSWTATVFDAAGNSSATGGKFAVVYCLT